MQTSVVTKHIFVQCLAVYISMITCVFGYNLDTERPQIFRHEDRQSMFGFSVAAYSLNHTGWLVVGAPRAQTEQRGVDRGGATYRCNTKLSTHVQSATFSCSEITFDKYGDATAAGRRLEVKSGQWLGATVSAVVTNNSDVTVAACAPRYVSLAASLRGRDRHDPVGTCFVARNNFKRVDEYSPCRSVKEWGHHRLGSCEAGLAMTLGKNGVKLYIGAIGSRYNHGQMFSLPLNDRVKLPPIKYFASSRIGQLFSRNLYSRPEAFATKFGSIDEDNIYLGYAVVTGNFGGSARRPRGTGTTDSQDVIVSAPRADNLVGKVLLYTADTLYNFRNVSGRQMGAYFGYSLCAVDVNGDQRDDLLVGAPFFASELTGNNLLYNTGSVTVFYQSSEGNLENKDHLYGEKAEGSFGLTIARLGDIDLDGIDDVAIAAPYSGETRAGVIFIYHGNSRGLTQTPSQVIEAGTFGVKSLGFALAGGSDLDDNKYTDLVVGDYESNSVLVLRSRPILHVTALVEYVNMSSSAIDLDSPELQCSSPGGDSVPCLLVNFCLKYSGAYVNEYTEFSVEIRLDTARVRGSRLHFRYPAFAVSRNFTVHAVKDTTWCLPAPLEVLFKEQIRDKLTRLQTTAFYTLAQRPNHFHTDSATLKNNEEEEPSLGAMISRSSSSPVSASVAIHKNCGRDHRCIPDLRLSLQHSPNVYLFGSRERLTLEVSVANTEEDAYEAMLYIQLPSVVHYIGTERADDDASLPVVCALRTGDLSHMLICDLGNPMMSGNLVHFFVHLMPHTDIEGGTDALNFTAHVNSTNSEIDGALDDNKAELFVQIRVNATLNAFGNAVPDLVFYNSSLYPSEGARSEREAGPEAWHVYQLINEGPSDLLAADVVLAWPAATADGENYLMYMMEQPQVEGPITCERVSYINPNALTLSKRPKSSVERQSIYKERAKRSHRRIQRSKIIREASDSLCSNKQCTLVYCQLTRMSTRDVASIRVRSRIWSNTLLKYFETHSVGTLHISSKLRATVTKLPYGVDPSDLPPLQLQVTTAVQLARLPAPPITWWIILLASIGGAIALSALILILHKIGFFERNNVESRRLD